MTTDQACRREVEELHAFFTEWFNGALPATGEAFARFDDALGPEFLMVAPSGATLQRDQVLDMVRGRHGATSADGFRIEIRNHVHRRTIGDLAVVTYEEWQRTNETEWNGRVSSVLFGPSETAPNGVTWLHLHETGMGC